MHCRRGAAGSHQRSPEVQRTIGSVGGNWFAESSLMKSVAPRHTRKLRRHACWRRTSQPPRDSMISARQARHHDYRLEDHRRRRSATPSVSPERNAGQQPGQVGRHRHPVLGKKGETGSTHVLVGAGSHQSAEYTRRRVSATDVRPTSRIHGDATHRSDRSSSAELPKGLAASAASAPRGPLSCRCVPDSDARCPAQVALHRKRRPTERSTPTTFSYSCVATFL
ncbi:hypothetical protein BKA25_001712 [Actinoalloteichus hymeniacidonis]|uniref:Uncharacterized protein n=1 Tax=Actinoalloteichus hymeniacidonis TaxID=340345 RepID=A0AAC9MZZ3_9PSEU|nr:hypothetical protein TL08_18705 [Actinoalloteichus hymeniacidonis]MBB5907396.1 hypothetical protein [Actinoalloteichus hymeniacidonis]